MFFMRRSSEHGAMAAGMQAENDFGSRGMIEANALLADGDPPIGADLQGGPEAPNIRPPWTGRGGADDGTFFLFGQIPGALSGLLQFSVGFASVAVEPQRIEVNVRLLQFGHLFTGEIGWEAFLPELVFAFDFAFGLGCGS